MSDFKLSAQLSGHDGDVRAVNFPSPDVVLSSSRDQSVRLWRKTADKPPVFDATIASQGHGYINSLAFVRPSTAWPEGLVVSAGAEAIIEVKRPSLTANDNADRLLIGHGNNVCALDVSPSGSYIVSGAWDGKAIVWGTDKWEMSAMLAHQGDVKSVWAVLAYDDNIVITASADTNVRIFNIKQESYGNELEPRRILSTGSVVRALCKLPGGFKGHPSGAEFASAGNDGIVRLWKLNGSQVGTLLGHDSFIYCLACLPTGEIVSSGEDRTVRIWRGTECVQTITHPAISVWSVAVCPENGDIVSGASDNVVRVFTRSAVRTANDETISLFDAAVQASAIPQEQLGPALNKEKMDPHSWLLNNSGKKDGQIKTVLEDNGSIGAYQWSLGQQKWVHVGTVVDSTGSSGRKVSYQGQEYDYVFDVDIEEGKPPLKLPYNLNQNPYEAATKFLGDNELPISYIDEVAKFITQNTQGATIGQGSAAPSADPYGTESRYKPDQPSQPAGGGGYLPHTEYLALTQAKWEPALKKLKSLNDKHLQAGNKHIAMNPDGVQRLEKLLQAAMGSAPKADGLPDLNEAHRSIFTIATQWPYSDRLPALDALRCLVAWPNVVSLSDKKFGNVVSIALRAALDTTDPVQPEIPAEELISQADANRLNVNNVMMSLRVATNLFATPVGRQLAKEEAHTLLSFLARVAGVDNQAAIGQENLNVQIALTSAAFNYACLAYNERSAVDLGGISTICQVAGTIALKHSDPEVLFRALMAIGMVLAIGGESRDLARALEVGQAVNEASKKTGEARVKSLARECLAYLGQ